MTLNQILYFQKVARLENYHQAGRRTVYLTAVPEPFDGSTGKRTWGSFI